MTFEQIIERFAAKRNGSGWKALCPAHPDKNPSLSIAEKGSAVVLHCFAGCAVEDVLAKSGLTFADLHQSATPRIIETYPYTSEKGEPLFEVVRFEPKDFRQRRPDGNGWIWNLNGTRRVLFNLPAVLAADRVVVVEGEKDALRANELGYVGTCNSGGAGKWKDEYSEVLRGKHVIVVPDQDEPGRKHAEQVAKSLLHKAASVSICNLPVKDLSDWPAELSDDALRELIDQATPWTEPAAEVLTSYSTAELFRVQEKQVSWLVWPFAAPGLTAIIDALPKVGKTKLLLEGIRASFDGRLFLNLPTRPMRVIYVSEQSAASLGMQAREVGFTGEEPVENLRWITRETWSRYVFTDFLEKLEKDFLRSGRYDALFVDTWHSVARLEDENAASEVNRLGNLTIDVAARNGLALTLGRHDRKSGGDVGLSGRSSIQLSGLVDVILHLVRVPGQTTQRKLETVGRVPGLPAVQMIDFVGGEYLNLGEPDAVPTSMRSRRELVAQWVAENPEITGVELAAKFAGMGIAVSGSQANRYRSGSTHEVRP